MTIATDALHFTYRQPFAAKMAQASFLDNYSNSNILCIVDLGGQNPKLNSPRVITKYSETRLSINSTGIYLDFKKAELYIDYLFLIIDLNPSSEWIFILEDDVKVFKPVEKLVYDFNGINPTEKLLLKIRLLLLAKGFKFSETSKVGGCGGTIIRKDIILKFTKSEWLKLLKPYFRIWGRALGADELLTLMAILTKSKIGSYDGFAETWYPTYYEKLIRNEIVTLHKFKDYYKL